MQPKISILIPTFNREKKIISLLKRIEHFFDNNENLKSSFEIHISNNGSIDNTEHLVTDFIKGKKYYYYYNQQNNLGFDKNIEFLFDQVKTEYLWFFSDDDIFYEFAFEKVLNAVRIEYPDVLLFSFAQPASNLELTFNFQQTIHNTRDKKEIINLIPLFPKLSIYVMKKIVIPEENKLYLNSVIGKGFYFLSLSYTILSLSPEPKLTILSEQLASSDNDYNHFSIDPDIFLYFYETFQHPFILKYLPNLYEEKKTLSYVNTLGYLFKIKDGSIIVNDENEYDTYIKKFHFRADILYKKPFLLLQFILLKTGQVNCYNKYGKLIYDKLVKPLRK